MLAERAAQLRRISQLRPEPPEAAMEFVRAHAQLHDVIQRVLFELDQRRSPSHDDLARTWADFQARLAEVASA